MSRDPVEPIGVPVTSPRAIRGPDAVRIRRIRWRAAGLALAIVLALAAPALAKLDLGDDHHGVVVLRCKLALVDTRASAGFFAGLFKSAFHLSGSDENSMRPDAYLVSVDHPDRSVRGQLQGDFVIVFPNLEPGEYRLDRVDGVISRSRVPGEDKNALGETWFRYRPEPEDPRHKLIQVFPGRISYFGDLTIRDLRYPETGIHSRDPREAIRCEMRWATAQAGKALERIQKQVADEPWKSRLPALIDSLRAAPPVDTAVTWTARAE